MITSRLHSIQYWQIFRKDKFKMNVSFVDLGVQYRSIKTEIDSAIQNVISRSDFVMGNDTKDLEESFASYCEARFGIGVDSGYSALELILRAYDIGHGDEVITAANTFIATALAVSTCGARPVLVDIDPVTYNMDSEKLKAAITPATRAVIPVHLYGQPADMDPILEIAKEHGLIVIEDACQAHGARYKGRRVGSLGDAAAFSFYPTKNLGAYGDGGMVVTSDPSIADRLHLLRNLGQSEKYYHQIKGYNHRLDTMQAAILNAKLPHLDGTNASRRHSANLYNQLLNPLVEVPIQSPWAEHVYHLYVIQTENRDELQSHLEESGIATAIHYPIPIHLQPAYKEFGYELGDFPITERFAGRILSLPMYPGITDVDVAYTTEVIVRFFEKEPLKVLTI
jgi:dTDP-4-amino-4,6-dideoxygalactose transaminase